MISPEILVLIPCHSLEDFPSEQTDQPAASLLNSFAVAFHPLLLAWTAEFPRWHRADDPPLPRRGQLILIPTVCDDWLPHGWADDARQAGAIVVSGLSDRQEMIDAALKVVDVDLSSIAAADDTSPEPEPEPSSEAEAASGTDSDSSPVDELESGDATEEEAADAGLVDCDSAECGSLRGDVAEDLVADFLSLGTCWLLVELLTRRMRQFGNIDETRFFQRARSAAKAAVAADGETAETHLRACFEMLLEARERFYPVECYLLDLCLAVPDVDHERLVPEVQQNVPWSLLVSTDDLEAICLKTPDLGPALREACQAGRVSMVGGEDRETSSPLLPLESVIYHLQRGRSELLRQTGKPPIVWGRRRFGLTALLPQLLTKFGYQAALHVVLDDGIYPDTEYTKLRWRGVDGTLIDALSRIPLAADGAASYLRFPVRMSESMDHDQVAGLILARWPTTVGPWFNDLRRSQKYAPCLGRFVTLDRFFEQTELPGQLSTYKPGEYFSPMLIQHVARREDRPIGRYVEHAARRRRFDTAAWSRATANVLMGKPVDANRWRSLEEQLEAAAPTSSNDSIEALSTELSQLEELAASELSRIIMQGAGEGRGLLVLNPLSSTRRIVVPLPADASPPAISGAVKAVEFDSTHPERSACIVEVPGGGYAWIPCRGSAALPAVPKLRLAEDGFLRNDLFEVAINVRTGGIGHVRYHNQRVKRLSQQLSFRFPRERTIPGGPESGAPTKSQYAEMQCHGHEVVCSGTACGEIATWGDIVDQTNGEKLASFRQSVRVWRALPTIEVDIELSDVKLPDGDPWNNYFASRFAWNDSTSAVTRAIYHSAQSFAGERFETSDYIEIASEDQRLTIIPHGLPFHRRAGDRMVDSLLLVSGETQRRFRFTIAVDAPYPLEAAWNATTPAAVIPVDRGPPRAGATGWFFHVDARHVQITRILDVHNDPRVVSALEQSEHTTVPSDPGFALRLIETEGRSKPVRLRCFRQPTFARKRDFRGETIAELIIDGDAVLVDVIAYEIVDIELRFGTP